MTMEAFEKQLAHASTDEELHALLEQLQEKDNEITTKLDKFVSTTQISQEHDIKRLDLLRTQLGTALNSSHEISKLLTNASYGATRISSNVRSIDLEKQRVNTALKYVEDVMLLRSSLTGCEDAMGRRDWEQAAQHVHEAMELPRSLIVGEFAKAMVPSGELPDYPEKTLQGFADSLGNLFLKEFNKAAGAKDMENVTRFFKLFPLIGQEKQGLDVYAKFICGIITTHSRTLMQSHNDSNPMFYALAMSRLFENMATIVARHAPIVEKHYGKGRMSRVVDRIQDEADSQGGLIMDTFWDERRVARLLNEIQSYSYPYLMSSFIRQRTETEGETVDLKHVNDLVGEISLMFNRWMLYKKFLAFRWNDFEGVEQEAGTLLHPPHILLDSGFNKKVTTKLSPALENMATFVFRRSIEKAFELEEMPDLWQKTTADSPLVSSSVTDIMLVFSSLTKQTIGTGELSLVKTIMSNIRRILEGDYVGMVQRKLRDGAPKQAPPIARPGTPVPNRALAGLSTSEDKRLRTFMVNLNCLSTIGRYIEQVIDSLVLDDLPFGDDADTVKQLLAALVTHFKGRCNDIVADGLRTIFNFVLKPKLTTLFNTATKAADYINNDEEYDMSTEFAVGWDKLMNEFQNVFIQENHTWLVSLAAQAISKMLERWVWSLEGKVNELGAIRLDRDVGRIITKSSERYHFREKFVKVAQIVTIIGLDDAEDEEGVAWALSDDERERARQIRIDKRY